MINTGEDNIDRARMIALNAKKEVWSVCDIFVSAERQINKLFRILEVDIDGIYCPMLLLQKKKYAAVSLSMSGSKVGRRCVLLTDFGCCLGWGAGG